MIPLIQQLPYWIRKSVLSVLAIGVLGIGVHDAVDDYRELASPQPSIVLNHERYVQQWVPDHAQQSAREDATHEKNPDEYMHLAQILEDEERINGIKTSSMEAAPIIRIIRCFSRDPGLGIPLGLLELPPNSGKATILNQTAVTQTAVANELICDDKETWVVKVDNTRVFYAERIRGKR